MTAIEMPLLSGCGRNSRENPRSVMCSDQLGGTGMALTPAVGAAGAGTEGEVRAP